SAGQLNTPVNFGSAPDLSDCQFSVGDNNQVVLDQINTTIKTGTHAERAQLANWLLTPNISHVLRKSCKTSPDVW
ncbi:hypothetical protein ACFOW3_13140, partial [Acidovorax facilis]